MLLAVVLLMAVLLVAVLLPAFLVQMPVHCNGVCGPALLAHC